jgi:hypothetical protein
MSAEREQKPASSLSVTVSGRKDAPLLFMMSGWPDDHSTWDDAMPMLEQNFRCARC